MKKIILSFFFFISFFSISYGYIDYRYDLKKDYYVSEQYIKKHLSEKHKIDKKLNIIKNKISSFTYDEKVDFIEKQKEKILRYLYTYHINKDNVIYYRLAYYYNKLDEIKNITPSNYKSKNYSKLYSNYFDYKLKYSVSNYYNSYYNNNSQNINTNISNTSSSSNTYTSKSCSLNFYGENYTLSDGEFKVLSHSDNSKTIYKAYKCNNGKLNLVKSRSQANTYSNTSNTYTSKSCNLNFYGENYTLSDGEFRVLSHNLGNKTIVKSYKCSNGTLKLIKSYTYNNYQTNYSCVFRLNNSIQKLKNNQYKIELKYYTYNGCIHLYEIKYICENGKIKIYKTKKW